MKNLTFLLLLIFVTGVNAQNSQLSIGGVNTELGKGAVELGLSILPDINRLSTFSARNNSTFSTTPDIQIQVGDEDAFSSIALKYEALFMKFNMTTVAGVQTPDLSRTFHVFSVALGTEADQSLETFNGLIELGYMPWYQNSAKGILSKTKFGVFLQGGNKFSQSVQDGGKSDESKENVDSGILRLKSSFHFSPQIRVLSKFNISPNGETHAWFDALNGQIYYKLKGAINFNFMDFTWEWKYEKGSGAPNFNQGEQFGTSLSIRF